jgi:tetratricopeptide (TPR) repeat protein
VALSPVAKRRLFGAILLLTPVIVLLLIEGALRFFSYGTDLSLVQRTTVRGREFYTINRMVGRRYFSQPGIAIPEPPDVLFPVMKSARTRRIFCLGESTMAGFPYEYNATPASLLHDQLASLLPADTIEVINVGLSAIGSTVVRDLIADLTPYEPDLFVIYLGHNEFYGVFGPGSTSPLAGSTWLTRLHLRLMRTRLYLLMQETYAWAGSLAHREQQSADATLMEEMGDRGGILLHGPVYERGLDIYRENLAGIIGEARAHGVPVLFSALVDNLADQPPFMSVFAPATNTATQDAVRRLIDESTTAAQQRAWVDASDALRRAIALDSSYASARFLLGRALREMGDSTGAAVEFRAARDLDALRFRATDEFQRTLIDVCDAHHVPVARVDSAFAVASPQGITGRGLILEHLHPNVQGYALMAKTWAAAIRDHRLISSSGPTGGLLPESLWVRTAPITPFDNAIGEIKTAQLTSRWPFTPAMRRGSPDPADTVNMIVARALRDHTAWTRARYAVAEWYEHRGDFARARTEYQAIAKALPYSFQPLVRRADAFAADGRTADAVAGYRQSIRVEENPYAHMKLGVILLQNADTPGAVAELERGFVVDAALGGAMTTGESAFGRSLLAYAYARTGRYADAKEQARKALALQPGQREATELLRRLP